MSSMMGRRAKPMLRCTQSIKARWQSWSLWIQSSASSEAEHWDTRGERISHGIPSLVNSRLSSCTSERSEEKNSIFIFFTLS